MKAVSQRTFLVAVVVLLLSPVVAAAQDSLTQAQTLYANAQYEEALATLDRMRAAGLAVTDVAPVEQYRALCLLALGRPSEAEDAIAAVITAMPSYAPPAQEVSPRVRSAFQDVRRRVAPSVIQQKYGDAKAAFDRKDYRTARDGFAQLVTVLGDPGLTDLVGQPPLSDLALLARGFHDLSVTSLATAASPAPAAPPSSITARGFDVSGTKAPVAPETPRRELVDAPPTQTAAAAIVYSATDVRVTAPVIVRQALPPYPRRPLMPQQGLVEVVINEGGEVESATMRQSVDAVYDALAVAAARTWQYRPAMRDGVAVKYRKGVQIRIQP